VASNSRIAEKFSPQEKEKKLKFWQSTFNRILQSLKANRNTVALNGTIILLLPSKTNSIPTTFDITASDVKNEKKTGF
jgi:hypothetical protein